MRVLGFNNSHDACAVLVEDGRVVAAIEEERLTRRKHQAGFPEKAIAWVLDREGCLASDLDAVAYYWNPRRGILRFGWHVLSHLPGSLDYFKSHPSIWRTMKGLKTLFRERFGFDGRFAYVDHHLCHAASSFYPSPFEEAAILTIDGTGEWETTLLAEGSGTRIRRLSSVGYPHSLGKVYEAVTQFLGFRPISGEGKVMGLAGHGEPRFIDAFRDIVRMDTHRYVVDTSCFQYHLGRSVKFSPKLVRLFGPPREEGAEITDRDRDLAASLQARLEEVALALARHLRKRTGARNLCIAGGVGFNSVMNGRLLREAGFDEVFITPAANDSGAALGAALETAYGTLGCRSRCELRTAALGPEYSDAQIEAVLRRSGVSWRKSDDVAAETAALIAEGRIVGWFQGRMEYGPRALGQRSLLADPRSPAMKDLLNRRVKKREPFRPFAPSVLLEEAPRYFEGAVASPFMLKVFPVRQEMRERIPAVTHVDGTARIQTLTREDNGLFYQLVAAFGRSTGVPLVLNTSFNVDGQPIVCTPEEAVDTCERAGLDALVLSSYIVTRSSDPDGGTP